MHQPQAACLMDECKRAVWLTQQKIGKSLTAGLRCCELTGTVFVI